MKEFSCEIVNLLFKYVSNAIITVNLDGEIVRMNNRACHLLDTTMENAMNKHILEIYKDSKLVDLMKTGEIEEQVEIRINQYTCNTTSVMYH